MLLIPTSTRTHRLLRLRPQHAMRLHGGPIAGANRLIWLEL